MKLTITLLLLIASIGVGLADAFSWVAHQAAYQAAQQDATANSKANNGKCPFSGQNGAKELKKRATTFNVAAQYVRCDRCSCMGGTKTCCGTCPGQNAMANHGYLPRNGYTTTLQCIDANVKVFKFRLDFSTILYVMGQLTSGTILGLTWAIGNASSVDPTVAAACLPVVKSAASSVPVVGGLLGGVIGSVLDPVITPVVCNVLNPLLNLVLGAGKGMAQTHLRYEGDTSIGRWDWGTKNGADASTINLDYFQQLWGDIGADGTYDDINIFIRHKKRRFDQSISTNPCFFNAPFAGVLASTAAYAFTLRLYGNRSADYPDGQLAREILAPFSGLQIQPDGTLVSLGKGYERIPDNWYKRADPYSLPDYQLIDFPRFLLADPRIGSIGGNTNGVNTFTGIDLGDLTGGVINSANLPDGNNFACFYYRLIQFAVEDSLSQAVGGTLLSLGSTLGQVIETAFTPLVGEIRGHARHTQRKTFTTILNIAVSRDYRDQSFE